MAARVGASAAAALGLFAFGAIALTVLIPAAVVLDYLLSYRTQPSATDLESAIR